MDRLVGPVEAMLGLVERATLGRRDARDARDAETRLPVLTVEAFIRRHGRAPRGWDSWAFRAATAPTAYNDQLRGEVVWLSGYWRTVAERAREELRGAAYVAVLA